MTKDYISMLNTAQKQAVEHINGPVMVVAGPGTGKTQLLASRVANILKQDPTALPSNILCLTFTEAGQVAMQKRLVDILGHVGSKVAVHTFHSFGSEIINFYGNYFFNGISVTPADDLTQYQIINDILDKLPANSPLAVKHEDEFIYTKTIKTRIGQFKKAISPDELNILLNDAEQFIGYIEPYLIELAESFSKINKKDIAKFGQLLQVASIYNQPSFGLKGFKPLSEVFITTLSLAYNDATANDSTTPITQWKNDWIIKLKGVFACKQSDRLAKLKITNEVYSLYQSQLHKLKLFDFDDMILTVISALESHDDLLFDLQEQYQYILVDEFQDTNRAQMRLLDAIASSPYQHEQPNILVVGDDDQAIYSFQGAELSNILDFKKSYPQTATITLSQNYRSADVILKPARQLILQGQQRLENNFSGIDKTLNPKAVFSNPKANFIALPTPNHELEFVAESIAKQINDGINPKEIAIIARENAQLEAVAPYLSALDVPYYFENRQNALDNPFVTELILLAKVVMHLSQQDNHNANSLLPELLSAQYWQIPAIDIWQLSLKAYDNREFWLQHCHENPKIKQASNFLIESAKYSLSHSLEQTLDLLIGSTILNEDDETVVDKNQIKSPYKNFYFNDQRLNNDPQGYIDLLACLTAIKRSLKNYKAGQNLNLKDFIEYIELVNKAKIKINVKGIYASSKDSVNLLTAHGSKGLEFESVFIINATKNKWGAKSRGSNISLLANMQLIDHQSTDDDALRLFYVAITRAKKYLNITYATNDNSGKEQLAYAPLLDQSVAEHLPLVQNSHKLNDNYINKVKRAKIIWQEHHILNKQTNYKALLNPTLDNYQLSPTHLKNFTDVTNNGPHSFFMNNILRFPSSFSYSASYGSAMHKALEHAHLYFNKNAKLPNKDYLNAIIAEQINATGLTKSDKDKAINQGQLIIDLLLKKGLPLFNQRQAPEINMRSQSYLDNGNIKLTGKLDVIEQNKNSIIVRDYKTGKAFSDWSNTGKSSYQKIKQHDYLQQLLFYKIIIDESRKYGAFGIKASIGEIVFLDSLQDGELINIRINYSDYQDELIRIKKLIKASWRFIVNLELPDVSGYSQDLKGIIAFEDWLIENS
jgi:DNA helicase-2/ATP-dependent DNA helicase PcrA